MFCSVSIVNEMLTWQEFKQLWNRFKWSDDLESTDIQSRYRGVATEFQMEGRDWETLDLFFQIVYLLLTVTPV